MQKNSVLSIPLLLVILTVISNQGFSQTSFNAGSHHATIGQSQFEYSFAEMSLVSTEHNSNLIVTQGYHQPQLNSSAGSALLQTSWAGNVKVYPNPVQNMLNIEINLIQQEEFKLEFIDLSGKIVFQQSVRQKNGNNIFTMDLSEYPAGVYFLILRPTINSFNHEPISFNIQKIN